MSAAGGWTLAVAPVPGCGDVQIRFAIDGYDRAIGIGLRLTRDEARAHAFAVLATTGDGFEWTFRPEVLAKPVIAEAPLAPAPIGASKEPAPTARASAIAQGFTGDTCDRCGRTRMLRTGICMTCQDCGATTGCA